MQVFGYIFIARDWSHALEAAEQEAAISAYVRELGLPSAQFVVEEDGDLEQPFRIRPVAAELLPRLGAGDILLVMKAAWILASAREGERLLQQLRGGAVALHCLDLGGNISLPEKRRLQIFEGPAALVGTLLAALAACENGGYDQVTHTTKGNGKKREKYTSGPVPFGWQVDGDGYLVPHPEQQHIIEAIAGLRRDRCSYREISRKLQQDYGVRMSHEGVRRLCKGVDY
jgi:hypothetical protein